MDSNKLENIISGHKINDDDADWLRGVLVARAEQEELVRAGWVPVEEPSTTQSQQDAQVVPDGYKLVLVPDDLAGDEPDWDEVKRQAEEAYGLKVGDVTMPILIREVRRWIAQKYSSSEKAVPTEAQHLTWDQVFSNDEIMGLNGRLLRLEMSKLMEVVQVIGSECADVWGVKLEKNRE